MSENQLRIRITWGEVSIEIEGNTSSPAINVVTPNTQNNPTESTPAITIETSTSDLAPDTANQPVTPAPATLPSLGSSLRVDFEGIYQTPAPVGPPPVYQQTQPLRVDFEGACQTPTPIAPPPAYVQVQPIRVDFEGQLQST